MFNESIPKDFQPTYPESNVLIISTGGTICMKKSPDGLIPEQNFLKFGLCPRPTFNDGSYPEPMEIFVNGTKRAARSLRTPYSAYGRQIRYCVLEYNPLLDSSTIDAKGWAQIARSVQENYHLFDGFVVLHGTDSLAYTCSALSFMLRNLGKPVILTGSQAPIMDLQNDAQDNLLSSLIIAGHFMIPEVCLFFNFKLFRGNRTTKISADGFDAFGSPNFPPLATISSRNTDVYWDRLHRPTELNPFSVMADLDTACVTVLRVFPGMKPEMVDAILRIEGLKGLVLESFGAGNPPGGPASPFTKVLIDAVKRGIVIVNVTQCLAGSALAIYAPAIALERAGVVFGLDMTTEAALTKLLYLFSIPGATPASVAADMTANIAGELTEKKKILFRHPDKATGALTPERTTLSAFSYAIQEGDLDQVKNILVSEPSNFSLNYADQSGNTPLHLSATGKSEAILEHLLTKGALVHVRNNDGHTPLFLAASAGLLKHTQLVIGAGAHLHQDEIQEAENRRDQDNNPCWKCALAPPLQSKQ